MRYLPVQAKSVVVQALPVFVPVLVRSLTSTSTTRLDGSPGQAQNSWTALEPQQVTRPWQVCDAWTSHAL
jgi:hypothetical protein